MLWAKISKNKHYVLYMNINNFLEKVFTLLACLKLSTVACKHYIHLGESSLFQVFKMWGR